MDQNDGLEAKIIKEVIRATLTVGLRETPLPLIRKSLRDQAAQMGTTIRTMEDHMINAQISHSIEVIEMISK